MKLRLPRRSGYVKITELKNLNPTLRIVKVKRKFGLKIRKRL